MPNATTARRYRRRLMRAVQLAMFCGWPVVAAPAEPRQATEQLKQLAVDAARQLLPAQLLDAEFSAHIDARLQLRQCGHLPSTRAPARLHGGRATIQLRCNAPAAWTLYVPVKIRQYRQVVTIQTPVSRGQPIPAGALALQRREVGSISTGYFTDVAAAAGRSARRALLPGQVLSPNDALAPSVVRRGQQVDLIARSGSLEIRASGRALADGAVAELIRVENLATRKIVEARVLSADEVEVRL